MPSWIEERLGQTDIKRDQPIEMRRSRKRERQKRNKDFRISKNEVGGNEHDRLHFLSLESSTKM